MFAKKGFDVQYLFFLNIKNILFKTKIFWILAEK